MMKSRDKLTHYQICFEGKLEERWLRWFEGLEVQTSADDQTIIRGEFDQSSDMAQRMEKRLQAKYLTVEEARA